VHYPVSPLVPSPPSLNWGGWQQVLLFTVTAWDVNCPQHIPQRFEAADV
jgi:predicted pyridoxine 5'-phosphate oxidase superfamily flavin-nucleotide-binding protein